MKTIRIAETKQEEGEGIHPVGTELGFYSHHLLLGPTGEKWMECGGRTVIISTLPSAISICLRALEDAQKNAQLH